MSERARFTSLYWRLLGALVVMLALVGATAGFLVARSWEREAIDHLTKSLVSATRLTAPLVRDVLEHPGEPEAVQQLAVKLGREAGYRVTIIDPDGRVLGDSELTMEEVARLENHAGRPEVRSALGGTVGTILRRSSTLAASLLYVAAPVPGGERIAGVFRVAVPVTMLGRWRAEIRKQVLGGIAIGLLVAILLSAWMAHRLSRPMSRLAALAGDYARGEFGARAGDASIREVRELGDALHAMAASLREHIDDLTAERNQATVILERLSEGVIAVDAGGQMLVLNPAARRLLGLAREGLVGRGLFETVRQHEVHDVVRDVLAQRRRVERNVTIFQPEERWLHVHGLPCDSPEPTGPRAILVIQDHTELARYDLMRREFVANVSHELKTPLTSIRSLAETLAGGALEDGTAARRFVRLIDEDAERLSRLIDDLLALSRIESQPAPATRPVEIRPLAESVLASLDPLVEKRRLRVTLEIPPEARVRADPDRVRQVLWNLIDNAIKYNKDGGLISLSAAVEGPRLRVVVADTGVGIPGGDLDRVFERFYRVDKARSRELGGTGLGLSIVKHIVESYGGRVEVESRPNAGSRFSVTFPLAA